MVLGQIIDIVRRKFTGEFGRIAQKAVNLIIKVEKEFQFDSEVKRVYVWPYKGSGDYRYRENWVLPGTIGVPDSPPRSRKLKEYVYHELGHAICDNFDIRSHMKPFIRKSVQTSTKEYDKAINSAESKPRFKGFVSSYARTNREEDFCETLSAYLCNRSTWRKSIRYEGVVIQTKHEPRLLRRLKAVHVLLRELKNYE
jgi:Putative zinc-binding metallo-peptidase